MKQITEYDKSKVYLEQIKPKIDEIITICAREKIPFAFGAAVVNTADTTYYERAGQLPAVSQIVLTNDYIANAGIALSGGRFIRDTDEGLADAVQSFEIPEDKATANFEPEVKNLDQL